MNKERFMKDFNGEKIFSLEYDKETLKDMVLEKQEEIEDLKKQIELLVKDDESSQQTIINQKQEIDKLDNIIMKIYTKALDTSITSLDLRDYIINLGSEMKND